MKSWKKGAVIGFLFIPAWLVLGWLFMSAATVSGNETIAGIVDGIFMLAFVPAYILLRPEDMEHIGPINLTSILFWTLTGALTGYLIEKVRKKFE
jgi:hypothetical protein